jgi:hypothetical protein
VRSLILGSFAGILCLALWMQPLAAQQAEPVGAVSNANNALVGTTPVSSGTTIFSGDLLKTGEAGRLQVQSGTMQFVFDANSAARIFRAGDRVTVELERGSVSYSAKGVSDNLTLFAQDIKFVPRSSELAVGTISIVTRCEVKASAVRGTLQATSGKETKTIDQNGSYNVLSEIGVEYNDSWKPVLQEYPEYPRDAEYHHSHNHVACAEGVWQTKKGPLLAGNEGHFKIVMAGAVAVVTAVIVIKALESPAKP